MLNVICIKYGDKYGPEYVDILARMVGRNLRPPYKFICFTDDPTGITEEIYVAPLTMLTDGKRIPRFEQGAWPKAMLYRKNIPIDGQILFLDLDIIIVQPIDEQVRCNEKEDFIICKEFENMPSDSRFNSSVFMLRSGTRPEVWREVELHGTHANYSCADQGVVSKILPDAKTFPVGWCVSGHSLKSVHQATELMDVVPKGAKIIAFHGYPKPQRFVKQFPIAEKYWR